MVVVIVFSHACFQRLLSLMSTIAAKPTFTNAFLGFL